MNMATKQYPRFNEFYLCNQPVFKMMFELGLKIKPDGILIGCLSYRTRTLRPAKSDSSVKQQDDDEERSARSGQWLEGLGVVNAFGSTCLMARRGRSSWSYLSHVVDIGGVHNRNNRDKLEIHSTAGNAPEAANSTPEPARNVAVLIMRSNYVVSRR
ncbi:hypothetical protein B0H14DRAFT_2591354 [Mycena olivaceomarginata]|nr:hypothetical protein B0H14DRAFT_2591354 [Mycena olivaceomarginata]